MPEPVAAGKSLAQDQRDTRTAIRRLWLAMRNAGSAVLPCTQQASSYTLALTDAETCVEMTSASATTVTIPPNSSVAFPVGAWVEIRQFGAGQVTMAGGSGVTVRSPAGAVKTCQQYTSVVAHQRATNDWVLVGDLV